MDIWMGSLHHHFCLRRTNYAILPWALNERIIAISGLYEKV
jgi:hypothetical protein